MSKEEFLYELEKALSGEMDVMEIQKNLQFYSGYIEEEKRKGKTEEEIIESLGSPRLIAKSILASYSKKRKARNDSTRTYVYEDDYVQGGSYSYQGENKGAKKNKVKNLFSIPLMILFIICLLILGSAILSLIIRIAIPILIILFIIYFLKKYL